MKTILTMTGPIQLPHDVMYKSDKDTELEVLKRKMVILTSRVEQLEDQLKEQTDKLNLDENDL